MSTDIGKIFEKEIQKVFRALRESHLLGWHRLADRGAAGYQGTVVSVGEPLQGKDYRWIEVRHPKGTKHVWPSNRLG